MNATKMKAKSHGTKAAFLTSLMSLILCFTMLVGTTLAWFTDTVTSGENQIIAGNLDIDVEYWTGSGTPTADGDSWKSIAGEKSLFSKGLWEPGHTEVVYLRVVNKGTLAFNYTLNVTPISETGGINVDGNSFQLSKYMCFAASEPLSAPVSYADRTEARKVFSSEQITAAVDGNSNLLQPMQEDSNRRAKTLYAANDIPTNVDNALSTAYMALVVYMPEDVGNVANYKTGTTAPQITLGVTAYAWQEDYEKDSFGYDYDAAADLTPGNEDAGIVEFDYFPQISMAGQVKVSDNSAVIKDNAGNEVAVDTNVVTVYSDTESDHSKSTASVSIAVTPVDGAAVGDTGTVTLNVKKDDTANANFQSTYTSAIDTTKQDSTTYEVSAAVTGQVKAADGALYTVTMNIGAGKENVKLYHKDKLMTDDGTTLTENADHFVYNKTTGVVTMKVSSFSPFTATYDKPVCAIGTTAYYSLAAAIQAAKSNDTITLIKDCETGDYYGITQEAMDAKKSAANPIVLDDANVTLDLNGKTITVTHNFSFVIAGNNDIVKNGTIKAKEMRGTNNAYYRGYPLVVAALDANAKVTGVKVEDVTIYGGISAGGSVEDNATEIKGGGEATLTNCTIQEGSMWSLYAQLGSTLNVVSGTYSAGSAGLACAEGAKDPYAISTINIQGGTYNGALKDKVDGTLSITGGTFSVDPSAYVKEGYLANANGTSPETWTVAQANYWSANAATSYKTAVDTTNKIVTISSAEELALFANQVAEGVEECYSGYTVNLTADIDLGGKLWTPIKPKDYNKVTTFDGQNHTISNMNATVVNVKNGDYYTEQSDAGLFGNVTSWTIKNITIDKATVKANSRVGGIAGQMISGSITNCTVKNSTIIAENVLLEANDGTGNAAGGIVGYFSGQNSVTISGCTVENCTVEGYRGVGGLVGRLQNPGAVYTGNTVKNTTIVADKYSGTMDYKNYNSKTIALNSAEPYFGALIGQFMDEATEQEGNTATSVSLSVVNK